MLDQPIPDDLIVMGERFWRVVRPVEIDVFSINPDTPPARWFVERVSWLLGGFRHGAGPKVVKNVVKTSIFCRTAE